jgi:hypothetical protein
MLVSISWQSDDGRWQGEDWATWSATEGARNGCDATIGRTGASSPDGSMRARANVRLQRVE